VAAERARAVEEASAREAARVKREIECQSDKQDPSIISWLGQAVRARATTDLDSQDSSPLRRPQQLKGGMPPTLSMWHQNEDGSITGVISNSRQFKPGTKITTSPARGKASDDSIITTVSGSKYLLERRRKVW
jgi:hypothetical protein